MLESNPCRKNNMLGCINDKYITVVFAVPGSLLLQKKANSDTFRLRWKPAHSTHSELLVETCVIYVANRIYVVLEPGRVGLMVKSA